MRDKGSQVFTLKSNNHLHNVLSKLALECGDERTERRQLRLDAGVNVCLQAHTQLLQSLEAQLV